MRSFVVAHRHKHHLYETALAYLEAGTLDSFLTERYLHSDILNRVAGAGAGLSRMAESALTYRDARISAKAQIVAHSLVQATAWRLAGARVRFLRSDDFLASVADYCVAEGVGCHTICTGALEIFQALKPSGLPCILEQYVGDPRTGASLVAGEYESLGLPVPEASFELAERNEREYELADLILAGSDFVRSSLTSVGVPQDKIVVVPYGTPSTLCLDASARRESHFGRVRVVFVGNDPVRKGIRTLVEAARTLGDEYTFTIVGAVPSAVQTALRAPSNVIFKGKLNKAEVLQELRNSDIGCLPTLWEGSSISVYEMLASGLPVVTTRSAGFPDPNCVRLVEPRNESDLSLALSELRDAAAREALAQAGQGCSNYTWHRYRASTRDAVAARFGP